jgi:hypothetical protein
MQTRMGSFVEAWANILVGFTINFAANLLVLPLFGFSVTPSDAFGIGVVFTAISLARSYVLRRWFNGLRWGHDSDPRMGWGCKAAMARLGEADEGKGL